MKKISSLVLPFLLLAVIAVGCGGGGKKSITVGGNKVDVSGSIPSDFPSDFPKYQGASVQGSIAGKNLGGVTGTWVSWTTGDSVDKVTQYYNTSFKDGPWKSSASGTTSGSSYWMADSPNGKNTAYVMVSSDSGKTSIVAVVGPKESTSSSSSDSTSTSSNSSSSDQTPGGSSSPSTGSDAATSSSGAPLPDEVKLSSDFPTDRVPLPSGARVTSDSSFSGGGMKTSAIEFYVKDKAQNVSDYFKTEAPKHGWQNAFSATQNGEYLLTFGGSSNEGLTISIQDSDTPGYAKATLTVVVSG